MKLSEDFDAQLVADGECLMWTRAKTDEGYGTLNVDGKMRGAHVFAWERVHGPAPKGAMVCHTCDRRACCNERHLFLSDGFGNMRDMAAKDRTGGCARKGARNHNAKLCEEDAARIRDIWRVGGRTQREIATYFGVTPKVISLTVRNMLWKEAA